MKDVVDTVSRGKYFAQIVQDDEPGESPREWDNLGVMVCWHRNYNLGDFTDRRNHGKEGYFFCDPSDFLEWYKENKKDVTVILPLFLYDHSGISMSVGRNYPYNDPWDSGQVGFIFAPREAVLKEYSVKRVSAAIRAKVEKILLQEVETYDQYLRGDVYGYQLFRIDNPDEFDPDNDDPVDYGEEIDSCWGYYGDDWKGEVDSLIAYYEEQDKKAAVDAEEKAWAAIPA